MAMKLNLPVNNIEKDLPATYNILSTTNLKGTITYTNKDFTDISGFTTEELQGFNHNIVRHPDMPPAAFADLWSTLKSEKPWMGIVKNRCKDGSYYWVDAYVTPIGSPNNIHEYQSVRTKPDTNIVRRAEHIYKQLINGKLPIALRLPRISTFTKLTIGFLFAIAPALVMLVTNSNLSTLALMSVITISIAAAAITTATISARVSRNAQSALKIINNPLMQYIYTNSTDELGATELVLKMRSSELRAIVGRILDSGTNLEKSIEHLTDTIKVTSDRVNAQQSETDQVATAMNEMSATVQDVARNTAHAASATLEAQQSAKSGQAVVNDTIASIRDVATSVAHASVVINQLHTNADNITKVVDVIRGIAEQTNLLALNAAIEAARAGEQGRGFAVVADEVRTLAQRTQKSTKEINDMVARLQTESGQAVTAMEAGRKKADACVNQATEAGNMLGKITDAVSIVNDVNTQIATAAEEQSAVAEEINRNVVKISELARDTSNTANQASKISQQLNDEAARQKKLVSQFLQT